MCIWRSGRNYIVQILTMLLFSQLFGGNFLFLHLLSHLQNIFYPSIPSFTQKIKINFVSICFTNFDILTIINLAMIVLDHFRKTNYFAILCYLFISSLFFIEIFFFLQAIGTHPSPLYPSKPLN